jgi:hypothetical protein
MERANDLEWLTFFYYNADLGPAEGDVKDDLMDSFIEETGKLLPEGWTYSDGETEPGSNSEEDED